MTEEHELAQSGERELIEALKALVPLLSEHASVAERQRKPVDEVMRAIEDTGAYRWFVPKAYGGYEYSLSGFMEVGMALGEGCASHAWVTTFCMEHNWLLSLYDKAGQDDIFGAHPYIIAPGSLAPNGKATPVDGGFRISGRWQWGTGVMHANWVMVGVLTPVEGRGSPTVAMFVLPVEDVQIIDTWYVEGMVGTGSNDIAIDDVFVPAHRLVDLAVVRDYHPFRVGQHVWIRPSWLGDDDGAQGDDIVLTLDPGMAFGTGLHPTTQMCMQALEQLVKPGMSVLDVGTGSGILAILAAKLGASDIVAVDTDELAVKTAVANAQQNQVADQISSQQGTLTAIEQKSWDIVVVNILAPVIMTMFAQDDLLGYAGANGRLILSGIIDEQGEAVETAVREAGGQIVQTLAIRDWVAFIVASS